MRIKFWQTSIAFAKASSLDEETFFQDPLSDILKKFENSISGKNTLYDHPERNFRTFESEMKNKRSPSRRSRIPKTNSNPKPTLMFDS